MTEVPLWSEFASASADCKAVTSWEDVLPNRVSRTATFAAGTTSATFSAADAALLPPVVAVQRMDSDVTMTSSARFCSSAASSYFPALTP